MKVLAAIVIPPHLTASGAVNAALYLSKALANYCAMDIALMASDEGKEQFGSAVLYKVRATNFLDFTKTILPDRFRTLFYRSRISELIASGDYDLVHIHNPIPALEMKRIAQACISKGIPYVVSTHGFVEVLSSEQAYSLRWYEKIAGHFFLNSPLRFVIDHANKIFGLTPSDISLLQSVGVDEHKITVIPNGVNEFYLGLPSEQEIQLVSQKFGQFQNQGKDIPVCIFLGNHTKNKGLDILFSAFLATKQPYTLIVCGKKRDYPYEQFAAQCKPGQLMIFTDRLAENEIRALFHLSDLFVFPTLADTMPLVILEAMAAGLPILSTKVGGIPYQVGNDSGLLVEPGNPDALRTGFESIITDRARLHTMGKAAHANVKSRFDWGQSGLLAFEQYKTIVEN